MIIISVARVENFPLLLPRLLTLSMCVCVCDMDIILYSISNNVRVPAARQHSAARGGVEGLQPDGGGAGPRQSQCLHQEQRGVRAPPPGLPERPQPDLPGTAAGRV